MRRIGGYRMGPYRHNIHPTCTVRHVATAEGLAYRVASWEDVPDRGKDQAHAYLGRGTVVCHARFDIRGGSLVEHG